MPSKQHGEYVCPSCFHWMPDGTLQTAGVHRAGPEIFVLMADACVREAVIRAGHVERLPAGHGDDHHGAGVFHPVRPERSLPGYETYDAHVPGPELTAEG